MADQAKIREALKKLDAKNNNHWTSDGLPRLETVRFYAKDNSLTREDITAADPEFKREGQQAAEGQQANDKPAAQKLSDAPGGKVEGDGHTPSGDSPLQQSEHPKEAEGSQSQTAGETVERDERATGPKVEIVQPEGTDTSKVEGELENASLTPVPQEVVGGEGGSMKSEERDHAGTPRSIPAPTMRPHRIAQTGGTYDTVEMGTYVGNAASDEEIEQQKRRDERETAQPKPMSVINPLSADPDAQRNEVETMDKVYEEGPVGDAKREVDRLKEEKAAYDQRIREAEDKVDEAKRQRSKEGKEETNQGTISQYLDASNQQRAQRSGQRQSLQESGVDMKNLKTALDPREPVDKARQPKQL